MPCRSCGTALVPDAAYCSHCGSRVELGSLLGVGTDLPPVPPREVPPPRGLGSQDLGRTAELPGVEPVRHEAPAHSRSTLLAMLATFVVLTILGTFALTRLTAPDVAASATTSPAATATPPGEGEEASGAETRAAPGAPSESASRTPSASASPSEAVGSGAVDAQRCSSSGDDAVATAYAGTDRTSCEFAAAVRTAYRKAGTPADVTPLRAWSPVTKKWYSLTCDGGEPVRCTTTTGAVVVLAPA